MFILLYFPLVSVIDLTLTKIEFPAGVDVTVAIENLKTRLLVRVFPNTTLPYTVRCDADSAVG